MVQVAPRFPLYIPSKGRWQHARRLTARTLDWMGVPFRLVVEPQELKAYENEVGRERVLELDMSYKEKYDTCDDLGLTKTIGSGPARNFIWDHSVSEGHDFHWIMDDNIRYFYRLNRNEETKCQDGAPFCWMEHFVLQYSNIGMAGPQYEKFIMRKRGWRPMALNSRIYSCNLIRNDVPFRWRGRYNEDTILSLDMLKAGWCTVEFYAFLQGKSGTMLVKGGNTDKLYADGTLEKSRMLARCHPDVARVSWRFSRWHHHVDYAPFKGLKLKRRVDAPSSTRDD